MPKTKTPPPAPPAANLAPDTIKDAGSSATQEVAKKKKGTKQLRRDSGLQTAVANLGMGGSGLKINK